MGEYEVRRIKNLDKQLMKGLTLVTTTHNRPYCFSILEKWMARQTVKWDQWLVVCDAGLEDYKFTLGQEVQQRRGSKTELARDPVTRKIIKGKFRKTYPSIVENWLKALPRIHYNKVIVIEDDDWYHPTYLETMAGLLDTYDVAGVKQDLYYKLRMKKFMRMHNVSHASLAATGWKHSKAMRAQVARVCEVFKSVFIDMYLWAECTATEGLPWVLVPNKAKDGRALRVGMKQMPGTPGLGNGHGPDGTNDWNFNILTEWVGMEDSRVYRTIPASAWSTPATAPGAG